MVQEVSLRRLDVAEEADISRLAEDLSAEGVTLDVLVNNAGIGLQGLDAGVARRTLGVNFYGPLRVTDALLPLIPDGGDIVMVSSGMGQLSSFGKDLQDALMDPDLDLDGLGGLMESFVEAVEEGRHREEGMARLRLPGLQGRAERPDPDPCFRSGGARYQRERRMPGMGAHRHGGTGSEPECGRGSLLNRLAHPAGGPAYRRVLSGRAADLLVKQLT